MFSSGPNYTKLKTHLKLAINRLKLLEKKKIELTQKARKEIADYISLGKVERARIRVEHIIREDYMVEALEMLEMYCDLLLARFGLIQQMKEVDPGLLEAIASVYWAGPRLVADVAEMKPICDQIALKYGKEFGEKSKNNVNDKFKHRLGVQAPAPVLVEKYLMEISKNFNIPYEPDSKVMKEAEASDLLDLSDSTINNLGGGSGGGGGGACIDPPGFRGYPAPPLVPSDFQPFNYPAGGPQPTGGLNVVGFVAPAPSNPPQSHKAAGFNIPVDDNMSQTFRHLQRESPPPSYSHVANIPPDDNKHNDDKPKPTPRGKLSPPDQKPQNNDIFPELPSVPSDLPDLTDGNTPRNADEIDFDDLNRRFENLKKGK